MSDPGIMRRLIGGALVLLCSEACNESGIITPNLERMIEQDRYQAYSPSSLFPDGRAMRTPPAGTEIHGGASLDPAIRTGAVDGAYVARIPIPVTRALLDRGQDRFNTYCAACHGVGGDGDSWVARKMTLRKPPTLIGPRVRAFPPGRIYQVIDQGYGLMRSYVEDLDQDDRWAVVAYVRALDTASGVPLDALPPAARARAEEELR